MDSSPLPEDKMMASDRSHGGGDPQRMSFLTEEPSRKNSQSLHQYTRFVQIMRIVLPLMAAVVIALLLVWPQFADESQFSNGIDVSEKPALKKEVQANKLKAARYENTDSRGRLYVIEADQAIQGEEDPDEINLDHPKAQLALNFDQSLHIKSVSGLYHQKSQDLQLRDSVYLSRSDGYVLKTQSLDANLDKGIADTSEAVFIEGPDVMLDAIGMRVRNKGMNVIFTGPVVVRFDLSGK